MKDNKHEQKRITSRSEDFSEWYQDIVDVAELAEHSPVRGSMTIKPYGYAIWENIVKVLDTKFRETGVENAYFPLFIPEKFLKKESQHVKGFSPQVAVVTHAGGKKLDEPLVVRPTSETIIYEAYSRWIESYRDLPVLINQWANVVRWELRPRLFLRTTEFLWQEGHTAHKTEQEAEEKTKQMLGVYKDFSENFLAIPVIGGLKTESEKFAGALRTYSIEGIMQDGKALQMGTSHNLGQNFSKPFKIKFLDEDNKIKYVWQTSWGLSTRVIGALIMAHSDDKGLVLPPKISPFKVVIIPVLSGNSDNNNVLSKADELAVKISKELGVEVKVDKRDETLGEKHYHWEKKGAPLRIEVGPKEIETGKLAVIRRDIGDKLTISEDVISSEISKLLDDIQSSLYKKAVEFRDKNTKEVDTWKEFKKEVEKGFVLAHWCGDADIERKINEETGATIRCIPFNQKKEEGKCVYSGKKSEGRVLFAKSY
ncbi:MAG: proline--tRNA ligase [Patescibacteria group bacterium]|nr:proline--tRNA ligase [Patescibacteria group bacterium]MBU1952639.1 proline--tRNA ligase [Patescibacteria group bacterium]